MSKAPSDLPPRDTWPTLKAGEFEALLRAMLLFYEEREFLRTIDSVEVLRTTSAPTPEKL